jgi:hypothetical protein
MTTAMAALQRLAVLTHCLRRCALPWPLSASYALKSLKINARTGLAEGFPSTLALFPEGSRTHD